VALEQQHVIEAEHAFAAARTIVEELAAQMHDESFRESLLRRAAVLIPAEPLALSRGAVKIEFGGLTAREREVATRIAQGQSNRQIAEALVVSERTITTHVSNIFAKLGFTSRAQIATWIGETGLATPPAK
jgi:DNA-binding NarL/FixJ family response regulator